MVLTQIQSPSTMRHSLMLPSKLPEQKVPSFGENAMQQTGSGPQRKTCSHLMSNSWSICCKLCSTLSHHWFLHFRSPAPGPVVTKYSRPGDQYYPSLGMTVAPSCAGRHLPQPVYRKARLHWGRATDRLGLRPTVASGTPGPGLQVSCQSLARCPGRATAVALSQPEA
jgi:hypothetical protein